MLPHPLHSTGGPRERNRSGSLAADVAGKCAAHPHAPPLFSEKPQDPKDPNSPTTYYLTVDGQEPKPFDPQFLRSQYRRTSGRRRGLDHRKSLAGSARFSHSSSAFSDAGMVWHPDQRTIPARHDSRAFLGRQDCAVSHGAVCAWIFAIPMRLAFFRFTATCSNTKTAG